MTTAGVASAIEAVERRGEDLRLLYTGGAQPNYFDALRQERSEPSGNPLSVALPPDAFFVAGNPDRPTFTRDGALAVRDGVLVSSDGTAVLGFPTGDTSGVPKPLAVEKNDAIVGRAQDLRVESDGVFGYARTVIDPKTLESHIERVVVGRVALARFPAGTRLERVDGSHARAPQSIVPFIGAPNDGGFGPLVTQQRAVGRLDPDTAISRLQDAYLALRAFGALQRSQNEMVRGAVDLVK